jgi:Asp-tRNA(Asn)/Glu-tRNA(Gln) amidotransferase A subunit family amidase
MPSLLLLLTLFTMIPSNFITGQQAIELVRSGHLTLSQVIKDHQDRYSERGALLKAWAMVNHEACIREAQGENTSKPLTGMTVGVKDIVGKLFSRSVHVQSD